MESQAQTSSAKPRDVPRDSFSVHPGVACACPHTDSTAGSKVQQLHLANWILPQQRAAKEAESLKCFQTHTPLFPAHGKDALSDSEAYQSPPQLQPAFLATNEEKCAREHSGEAANEGKHLRMHMQDAKIAQTVQQAENVSQTAERVRIAKCLLGELKALIAEQGRRVHMHASL